MTVQDVFDIAIRLMDEQNEATGSTDTSDTREYSVRTCSILNSVIDGLYRYDSSYAPTGGTPCEYPETFSAMSNEVKLDLCIARGVLPYILASRLLAEENADLSEQFERRYREKLSDLASCSGAYQDSVEDLYGGIECGEFARW